MCYTLVMEETNQQEANNMKTPNATHTPTPWSIFEVAGHPTDNRVETISGEWIATASKEDAAHIVKCVNSHEELLAELKNIRCPECGASYGYADIDPCNDCKDTRDVIARAEGGK